ncbi:MAG: glycosyl hydrolase [Prevotellaceae bacterium]|jgi:glucosylceramidase|nr:glycosyl hydrolase [Prevotellaceae bacterium]
MKNRKTIFKTALIGALCAVSTANFAQTEGKKVQVFSSWEGEKKMMVEQQASVFKQDFKTENPVINICPEFKYQEVIGFGGAFTETSAYNFSLLAPEKQTELSEMLFGKKGIGFNLCRTTIHSCDFSLDEYTYVKEGDFDLKTFDISRDKKYILPFILQAKKINPDLQLFASPWSPPAFMKDNNSKSMIKGGKLLKQYYPNWAKYFSLYLQNYKKEGVDFLAVSIQNEPIAIQPWESCFWTGAEEGDFAVNYLRPTLDKAGFANTKIIVWDHNKERVAERAREAISVKGGDKAIWGVGFHWYSGDHFDNLRMAHELYPDKPLIATEFCLSPETTGEAVWGEVEKTSWAAVEKYAGEILSNFNNFMAGSVEWNLIVDLKGGPYHDRAAGVSAPVYVDADKKDFILGDLYYAVGHFSKFVKRGALRIGTSSYSDNVKTTAFQNPDGEIIVIVLNKTDKKITPKLRLNNCTAEFTLAPKSLNTFVIPAKSSGKSELKKNIKQQPQPLERKIRLEQVQ